MVGVIVIFLVMGVIAVVGALLFVSADETKLSDRQRKLAESMGNFCKYIAAGCFAMAIATPFVVPKYNVWQQNKEGEAELARAEQNRQIAVQEAKAKEEAARSLANAEIIRAQGVAQANKIIGDSLQNNDAYIHYLWIEALKESKNDVIYIPTEAGIPITESARFFQKRQQE